MTKKVNARGFTLLEILLVVGIIAILAGIVILAINPTKQLGDARNAQRRSDVLTIINGIYQYAIDPGNDVTDLLDGSPEATAEDDCSATVGGDAYTLLDDALAGASSTYMSGIPVDPIDGVVGGLSGYYVHLNTDTGRVTVCAPSAADDNSATVEVTR